HTRSYGDWSSDVCSSDLGTIFRGEIGVDLSKRENVFIFGVMRELHSSDDDANTRIARFYLIDDRLQIVPNLRDRHAAKGVVNTELEDKDEIGRASCRERGESWEVE